MSKQYYSRLIGEKYRCPYCNGKNLQLDTQRSEIYCAECGVVISNPLGEGILPYDYTEKQMDFNDNQKEITNYRHSFTNRQLMKRNR